MRDELRRESPIPLGSAADLNQALAESEASRVWIFKHSASCGLSQQALRNFKAFARQSDSDRFWMLTVQKSPAVSSMVERTLNILHDTPQAILLWQGKVVSFKTHWKITEATLADMRLLVA